MKPIIYPYNISSNSAKLLAEKLNTKRVYPNKKYKYKQGHIIINWGNTTIPQWDERFTTGEDNFNYLNRPEDVLFAVNKKYFFEVLRDSGNVNIPEFTTNKEIAKQWEGQVIGRKVVKGTQGNGIVFPWDGEEDCQLYVKYIKKNREYRVHVFLGQVIDIQQKKKKKDIENINYQIRNHKNGWIFARDNIEVPEEVIEQALRAVEDLWLDFGAVDVIYNDHYQKAYVLEINTAPGLEGQTLDNYVNAIENYIHSLEG